jgi:lysophospholipase
MNFFESRHDLIKIAYKIYPVENPLYKIVFLTGRAEFFQKYEPLFKIFNEKRISVYAMDHRGQGASGRILDDPHKGHVVKFSHYVDDAYDFIENIVMSSSRSIPVISLSHSMGGAISLLVAERKKGVFEKVIFSSPMWGINLGFLGHKVALTIAGVALALGKGESYLPGKKGYWADRPFHNNQLTHSLGNFNRQKKMVEKEPHLAIGGPTYNWLYESLKTIDELHTKKIDTGSKYLLLQAEQDSVVDNRYQDKLATKLADLEKFVVKGSWHEIFYEEQSCFKQALKKILSFLDIKYI